VPSIFDHLDYRDLLRDAFDAKKVADPSFTYRKFAEFIGLHASNVFRLLRKETHLAARCQSRAIEFLGLSDRGASYFLLLVAYARERDADAKRVLLDKAMALRDVNRQELGEKDLAYLREWWVAAVRGTIEVVEGRANPAEIASKLDPPVAEEDVADAIEILRELGFVKRASSGRLVVGSPHLGVSRGEEKVQAVRRYQRQVLDLASRSLERCPPERRDVTTLTMAVDQEVFLKVRDLLQECRRLIQKSSQEGHAPDRVMQLVMAYFPLTREEPGP